MSALASALLPLGVIPIFASAGAALLPAVLAGLSSFLALLLRPRELVAACVRRPAIPAVIVTVVLASWLGWHLLAGDTADGGRPGTGRPGTGRPGTLRPGTAVAGTDWTAVAREILRRRELGTSPLTVIAPPTGVDDPAVELIFRTGNDRRGWDGGAAPLDLELAWSYTLEETLFLSSPVARGGAVYSASCMLDVGGTYGSVFSLDAATGRARWECETIAPVSGKTVELRGFFSSPALSADLTSLVIGQGLHADADCDLLCLEADSGQLRWRVPTGLHIESSPAISGDLVVAGAGAIESGDDHRVTGDPGFVLAVRLSSGEELWRHAIADPESSPAIVGDSVYIGSGFNGHALVALRTADGDTLARQGLPRERWRIDSPHPMTAAVTVTGDLVLAAGGNGDFVFSDPKPAGVVIAADAASGTVRWRRDDLPGSALGAIAAGDTTAGSIAVCGLQSGDVLALDLVDGHTIWSKNVANGASVLAAPALTRSHVYVVTSDGYLVVLDVESGETRERLFVNARAGPQRLALSSPTVAGGFLYVGSETGGLRCYRGRRYE